MRVRKGGSAAMMALTSHRLGGHRTTWLFDTFEGFRHLQRMIPIGR